MFSRTTQRCISGACKAFTLVELVVAVGLFAMLMLLVNLLFNQTTRAVNTGIAGGDLTVTAEALNNTFQRNAGDMLAAGTDTEPGGFLVIINRTIPAVSMPDPTIRGARLPQTLRSDQLLFVRSLDESVSLTPRSNDNWTPDTTVAHHALIWFGHAGAADRFGNYMSDTFGSGSIGSHWILARHNLILAKHDASPAPGNYVSSFSVHDVAAGFAGQSRYRGMTDIYYNTSGSLNPLDDLQSFVGSPFISRSVIENLAFLDLAGRGFLVNVQPAPSEARTIAQTHGLLATQLSDFIIEFAGDYDNSTQGIDRYSSGVWNSSTRWYSGFDTDDTSSITPPIDATIRTAINHDLSNPSGAGTQHIFAFPHGDNTHWPMAIRIRYRLHDYRGEIISSRDWVDSSGNPITETVSGRWYETIIPVTR